MSYRVGRSEFRLEDEPLVRGRGRYTDDVRFDDEAVLVVVRSPFASGRLSGLDVSEARQAPGVLAVLTGEDQPDAWPGFVPRFRWPAPGGGEMYVPAFLPLARDAVRHVGEPVAAIVAETRAQAEAAAELVMIDVEDAPAVVDPEEATAPGAPDVWPDCPATSPSASSWATARPWTPPWPPRTAWSASACRSPAWRRRRSRRATRSLPWTGRPAATRCASARRRRTGSARPCARRWPCRRSGCASSASTRAARSASRTRPIPSTRCSCSPRSGPGGRSAGSRRGWNPSWPTATRASRSSRPRSPSTRTAASSRSTCARRPISGRISARCRPTRWSTTSAASPASIAPRRSPRRSTASSPTPRT